MVILYNIATKLLVCLSFSLLWFLVLFSSRKKSLLTTLYSIDNSSDFWYLFFQKKKKLCWQHYTVLTARDIFQAHNLWHGQWLSPIKYLRHHQCRVLDIHILHTVCPPHVVLYAYPDHSCVYSFIANFQNTCTMCLPYIASSIILTVCVFTLSLQSFQKLLKKEKNPILVMFYAPCE